MVIAVEVIKAEGARNRRDMPEFPCLETDGQFFKRYRSLCQKRLSEGEASKTKRRRKKKDISSLGI